MSMENAMSKKLNGRGGRVVLLAAALLFAWGLRADTATVDGYTYTYSVTDGKVTIGTGETVKTAVSPKPTGRLTVPSELGGYPVTGLGESAFYNCTGVTDVTIPNGVTHIGPRAFSCCSGLVNVTIGSGVTSIEPYVFPSCVNLRNIAVDPANTAYMSQDGMLLTKDGTMLVYGVGGDVEIPSGVATIGTSAFFGRKLKSIRFSGSVTNIGSWAFGFCHDLDMSIPNTILKIGDYAFVECRNLNLWLPRRFEGNLNSSVFKQCSNLTVNYYDQVPVVAFRAEEGVVEQRECLPGTKVGSLPPASTCEGYAFEGWWTAADGEQATAETVVTNDVTYYAKWRGTATVDSYTYTYSVLNGQAEIGASNAWTRAISPSPTGHVTVPSSLGGFPVVGIGDYAFYGLYSAHYKLESVTIPNGVTRIGKRAFSGCPNLTDVTIPASMAVVDNGAFSGCSNLKGVHISNLVNWCQITFVYSSNPLRQAHELYLNGERVTRLTIPESVTAIGDDAFAGCSGLMDVTIPNSVTNIGMWAFEGCHGLTNIVVEPENANYISKSGLLLTKDGSTLVQGVNGVVEIPSGVTVVGESAFRDLDGLTKVTLPAGIEVIRPSAFYGCDGLTDVVIPASVTDIGEYAFTVCSHLMSISVEAGNEVYSSRNGMLLNKDGTTLIQGVNGEVEIPSDVTTIGAWAFCGYPGLTRVVIPASVRDIGAYAFHYCESLTNVVMQGGVTNIGDGAFGGCGNLAGIVIPDGVTCIGQAAFMDCTGLTDVFISNSVQSIGYGVFAYCGRLKNLMLPACMVEGDDGWTMWNVFQGTSVENVMMAEGITTIGSYAFAQGFTDETCPTHVTIPSSVTGICAYAFYNCPGLKSVTIPEGVVRIGTGAFYDCRNLTELAIPSSVKQIDSRAFSDCRSLTEITIPNSVTNIGDDAFSYCRGLGNVTVPACVLETRLRGVFRGASSITNVVLSEGVRDIGYDAFGAIRYGSWDLEHVFIPGSVTNIDVEAFRAFRGKIAVTVDPANAVYSSRDGMLLTKDGMRLLQGVSGDVTVPPGVTSIDARAFYNCSGLTRVVIPNSVTNIGNYAFNACSNLGDVWMPKHLEGKLSANVFANCGNATLNYYDKAYTVTFRMEEGVVEQRPCPDGASIGTLPPTPTHAGYAFEGWWTAADGEQATEETIVSDDVTYYAKWRGTATVDGYTYTYSVLNGQAEIGSSNTRRAVSPEPTGHVAVPSSLGGFPVVGIGKYAFYNCYELEGVTIPEGVTAIGKYAFDVCSKLEGVTIPEGVAAIGEGAFSNCPKLDSVTIPESVTAIGQYAFQWCDGLKSVHISNLTAWCQIKFDYYANPLRQAHELYLNGERVTKLIFPEGLKAVGTEAFAGCSGLTEVTIPDGVTIIGNRAFSGCSGLTEVTIPNGVTAIGNAAFSGCSGLTEVTLPNGVTTIGDSAFSGCRGLTEVEIPHGVKIIDVGVFAGCSGLTKITVDPKNVNYMSQNGLLLTKDGKTLKEGVNGEVVIPPGVTMIGYRAFADRDRLTKVTIPAGVEVIGWEVFYGCDGLVDVAIPGSVTDIGLRAFAICSRLMNISVDPGNKVYSSRNGMLLTKDGTTLIQGVNGEVEFPSCVRMIGTQAFEGCSGLTRLVIPDNVTNIASRAFAYYRGLTDVMIPDDIQFVGDDAFGNCGRLANVTIPICLVERSSGYFGSEPRAGNVFNSTGIENATLAEGATTIGSYALAWTFNDKTVPAHVTIPNSVTSICNGAFWYCPGLKSVAIPESVVSIGRDAFYDCGGLTEVTIPNSVTNIEAEAFPHCTSLGSVTVPACVLDIGLSDVFSGTTSITNVVLAEGVQNVAHDALGTYPTQFHYRLKHVFIPASVTNIDVEVFRTFQGKVAVTVDPANAVYSSWNGMLLTKDGTRLLQGVSGDVTIPPGVTSIDAYAFYGCSLTSLTIPSSVTSIGERAFYNCSNLTDLTIPDSVTDIGGSAFGNCRNLRNVWLPKHLEGKLGSTVFANCGNATLNYYDALYCVTFRTEEGIVEQRQCPSGMKVGALPPTPTYAGYAFEGWWTAADGEKATEKTAVTNDVTYYAKWRGTAVVGDYTYTYSVLNGQAEIGSSNTWTTAVSPKPTGAVVIPSYLGGYPVTGIGQWAFAYCYDVTSFEIPKSVVGIGQRAFACCYDVTSFEIPKSVVDIHKLAFEVCYNLVNFTVDPANAVYSSRNGLLLSKDGRTLLRGVIGEVVIPSCVTEIGDSAFDGCYDLKDVTIPNGVLSIGTCAFRYCRRLTGMTIPQSVTNIGTRAFTGCDELWTFSVDPANRFYSSRGGLLLNKDGTVLVRGINDCGVVIPDGVTTIGEAAFECCDWLESVEIPESVTAIGYAAFAGCWSLTSIEIPRGVTTIGNSAFSECTSLMSVEIPESVTAIGNSAFYRCESLTSIEIPRGVTKIKYETFSGCTGLVSRVVIPDNVTSIEWNAFAWCRELKEVWLPRGLENRFYPGSVFWRCDEALVLNYYDTPLHTVVFQSDEGTEKRRLCPAGMTLGELPPSPTRAGAVFSGWWTSDGERVSAETVVMGDMTLVARWRAVAAPVITPDDGTTFRESETCTVTITCADADAVIYYSTDGRTPRLTAACRYTGPFTIDRTTTIRAVAVLDGVRSAYVAATLTQEIFMPQYHDGRPDTDAVWLTFTTGGDAPWNYDLDWENMNGSYDIRMQSGQIGNEEASWLQTSVVGRGTFSFRWKVDCEYDDFGEAAWDHLAVFTNGVEAVRMDGTRGWERMSFTFDDDGRHTIRWVFVKDGYDEEDAAYEDCAWLGRFSWNPADVAVDTGKGRTVTVPGAWLGKRTMRAATDVAANGRRVWECYLLGLDPEKADDDFRIASFEVVDGVPAFTFSHTRDGSGVSFEPRIRILGKARLDDAAWTEMPEGGDPALRFFKAEVALP